MLIIMTAGLMTMDGLGSSTRRLWRPRRPEGGGGEVCKWVNKTGFLFHGWQTLYAPG